MAVGRGKSRASRGRSSGVATTRRWGTARSVGGLAVARSVATAPRPAVLKARARTRALAASVFFSAAARRQLNRQECARGVENGGALFGFYERAARQPLVCELVGTALEGSSTRLRFAVGDIDAIAERHRETTGWRLCGTWHSHPTPWWARPGEEGEPSETDVRTWRSWWQDQANGEMPVFAGVIGSETGGLGRHNGGRYPQIDGCLVEAADGNLGTRKVRVDVERGWNT